MAQQKKPTSFPQLSDAEKTAAAKEFDHPLPASRIKPLGKKQRLLWDHARNQKPDVSIHVSQGKADVIIHFDPGLLAEVRAFAAKNKTSLPKDD